MAIKWKDFVFENLWGVVESQRRLAKKQAGEQFESAYEVKEEEGKPPHLKPKKVTIDVDSHTVEVTEDDMIEDGDVLLIDEAELDIETDIDLEELPEEEKTEDEFFQLVTRATKKLFGNNTHIKMKVKMKKYPAAKGLSILRDHHAKKVRDELKGIKRHERK